MVLEEYYFPYNSLRIGQKNFIEKVNETIVNGKKVLISAPTGLGKTVSALAPALKFAKKNDKTLIYLTSRQTQINQVMKTLKKINEKYNVDINGVGFVGKRNMCLLDEKEEYYGSEFNDFCKKAKETGKCKYFKNFKNEDNESIVENIIKNSNEHFYTIEKFTEECRYANLCPYEVASKKAFNADVIVCDFNYFFSQNIREMFLGKIGRVENEIILIVDEAHNLPDRIRNMYSVGMSIEGINRALKESKDFFKTSKYDGYLTKLKNILEDIYLEKLNKKKKEALVSKKEFIDLVNKRLGSYLKLLDELRDAEKIVKEDRIISFIGRIANFLEFWREIDEHNFIRIIEQREVRIGGKITKNIYLKILNIDPSVISSEILNSVYSSVLMSATLNPLEMYRDILGVQDAELIEYKSPFPKENLKLLILDDVTTRYTMRGEKMFRNYAKYIYDFLTKFKKNSIVFFPSYELMDRIMMFLDYNKLNMRILKERVGMSKEEKEEFVNKFKDPLKKTVLFGVTNGSFSEGLDLPDDALELVLVVGLPLPKPDVIIESIIEKYDKDFGKGKEYGYVYPAISKIIQAGGRCIRTENDKGIVVLLDSRFKWPYYSKIYPKFWKLEKFIDFKDIENFFN